MAHDRVDITSVELLGAYRVQLTFDDGEQRQRNLRHLLTGPVFEEIRLDPAEFAKVAVDPDLGVLCWPNGADIDAELLRYDDLWGLAAGLTPSA
jgi:hypothetical protein